MEVAGSNPTEVNFSLARGDSQISFNGTITKGIYCIGSIAYFRLPNIFKKKLSAPHSTDSPSKTIQHAQSFCYCACYIVTECIFEACAPRKPLEFKIYFFQVPNHTEDDCPLTVLPCPYEKLGCKTKVCTPS